MATDLPNNLLQYFAAQNAHDVDGMVARFAPDAEVKDEGRTYFGRDAIREWKRETSAKYHVNVEPLITSEKDDILSVVARVAGNFPGSPAKLTYYFVLDRAGLIQRLEIH